MSISGIFLPRQAVARDELFEVLQFQRSREKQSYFSESWAKGKS